MAQNPVVELTAAGQAFSAPATILAVLWVGATTQADTVVLETGEGGLLWRGRTDVANTYLGINFGPIGLHSATGFRLRSIAAGSVLIYLL